VVTNDEVVAQFIDRLADPDLTREQFDDLVYRIRVLRQLQEN